jgi:SAM-dependent methyltransferase
VSDVSDVWERQRRSFEHTAATYDAFRPTYPDDLFADLGAYAQLQPGDRILEIGCATGQATLPIARWGHSILALEPAAAMVEVAARNLAAFKHVEFETTTFENWTIEPAAFGLIVSAQAFHWLDPETKHGRCGDALRENGTLALIWNTQVTPAHNRPFYERAQEVYLEHAPAIAHKGEFRTEANDDRELHDMERTGLFTDCEVRRYAWDWTLDRDAYIGLLSSHSPHAALHDEQRKALLDGIAELIDAEFDGRVTEYHVAELFCGRRR